jgi:hypothetical protein
MLVDDGLCQRRVPYQYYYAWKRELRGLRYSDFVIFKILSYFFDISSCATVTYPFFTTVTHHFLFRQPFLRFCRVVQ